MNDKDRVIKTLSGLDRISFNNLMIKTGINRSELRMIINELLIELIVSVDERYNYYLVKKINDVEYKRHESKSRDLERRGLFRRAANEWLEAMQSTSNAILIETAIKNREKCLNRVSKIRTSQNGYLAGCCNQNTYNLLNL